MDIDKLLETNGLRWKTAYGSIITEGSQNCKASLYNILIDERRDDVINVLSALRKSHYSNVVPTIFNQYVEGQKLTYVILNPMAKQFMENTEDIGVGTVSKDAKVINLGNNKNLTKTIQKAFISRYTEIKCKSVLLFVDATCSKHMHNTLNIVLNGKEIFIESCHYNIYYYDENTKTICGKLNKRVYNKIYGLYNYHKEIVARVKQKKIEAEKQAELKKIKNELFSINSDGTGQLSLTGDNGGGELEISTNQLY